MSRAVYEIDIKLQIFASHPDKNDTPFETFQRVHGLLDSLDSVVIVSESLHPVERT